MTYETLKHKILALLSVDESDKEEGSAYAMIEPLLPFTIDSVLRKTALILKNIMCTDILFFEKGAVGVQARLPASAFAVRHIQKNGKIYGSESFMMIGRELVFFEDGEGEFTVFYYAFPAPYCEDTDDFAEVPFDDAAADAVAYGAAGELSHTLYPSDMTRYMRLMTEYDARIAGDSSRVGEDAVHNSFFAKARGVR